MQYTELVANRMRPLQATGSWLSEFAKYLKRTKKVKLRLKQRKMQKSLPSSLQAKATLILQVIKSTANLSLGVSIA